MVAVPAPHVAPVALTVRFANYISPFLVQIATNFKKIIFKVFVLFVALTGNGTHYDLHKGNKYYIINNV
jgi:hypothetical protein